MDNNNWISVSSELPKENESVQVTYIGCPDNVYYCDAFAYLDRGTWHWAVNDDKCNALKLKAYHYIETLGSK